MAVRKPLRIFRSPLTDRYYATRSFTREANGAITVSGNPDDVTDEIEAIVRARARKVIIAPGIGNGTPWTRTEIDFGGGKALSIDGICVVFGHGRTPEAKPR